MPDPDRMPRRPVLAGIGLGMAAARPAVAQELAARIGARFDALQEAGRLPNLHAVLALQDGAVIFERYLTGTDNARGRPLGTVAFGPDTLHDLRSVSKSIVGLVYGIALARGLVPPPEAPLLAQFPSHADLAADPRRAGWTMRHALTMTLGTEWNEDLPYTSAANSEIAMDRAPDRYRFVLDRPFAAEPGARWIYNGGATALLGALIARGTGQGLHAAARALLFDPLGLGATEWAADAGGEAFAASGLRMTAPDLGRIGLTVLAGGAWQGREIVPAAWIEQSFRPAAVLPDGRRYGYQWYMGRLPRWPQQALREGEPFEAWRGAIGNGGQRLFLLPERRLAVVVFAGNYNLPAQGAAPLAVLHEAILPELPG